MYEQEVSLSLTTPVFRDFDSVFPGENWFFYWKTSASLWKERLAELSGTSRVIIPINWSFHSDTGQKYDFADTRPETDLKKLIEVAKEVGKEPVFFLPLGPSPFLPNGGLPALLARTCSVDEEQRPLAVIDRDGNIHKPYSFYDTRVFKSFSLFVKELGQYFLKESINCDLFGYEPGFIDENGFTSFFLDHSNVYKTGLDKFLEVSTSSSSHGQRIEFSNMIRNLYLEVAEKSLERNWEGAIKVGFLGGSPSSFFNRLYDADHITEYCQDLLETLSLDVLPSSVLLPARLKKGVFNQMLQNLIIDGHLEQLLEKNSFDESATGKFRPISFFEVYDLGEEQDPEAAHWADLGLWDYLQKEFSWCFFDRSQSDYLFDESVEGRGKVFLFHGLSMDKKLFHNVLKTFMAGGSIILNRSGLSKELLQRLEAFLIENSLNVEKVNFYCPVHYVTLGEGRLLIFEGDLLADLSHSDTFNFWKKVISTYKLSYLKVPEVDGVLSAWRVRDVGHQELNYEEVRRLGIYNPSSYKRKMKLSVPKNFKILKIVDEKNVEVKTFPSEIELELLPEASVSVDFGVFS